MNGRPRAYPAVLLALLLAASLLALPASRADPAIADEGGGFKRATWDFATPGDYNYSAANLSVAQGSTTLAKRFGARNYTDDAAFLAAQESVDRAVVSSGVRLEGSSANLVADGVFNLSAGPWAFTNSSNGYVRAEWDAGRARFSHASPRSQFDSMDAPMWGPAASGPGNNSNLFSEGSIRREGSGSLRVDVTLSGWPGGWAGAQRDDAGPCPGSGCWDWSAYTDLAVWINVSVAGLTAYLNLTDWANMGWNTNARALSPGWGRYTFDLSGTGNLMEVDIVQIRFTGLAGSATAYVDDLVLFNETAFLETATVSQTFTKPNVTSGTPGALVLTFDLEATPSVYVGSYLQVAVDGSWQWSDDSPVPPGTRSVYVDMSGDLVLRPSGSFLLEFSLELTRLPGYESSVSVWLDNVRITATDYRNGSFTATPIDAGSSANWTSASLAKATPPGTDVAASTRTGPDGASWSAWQAVLGGAIQSPPNRFLQWRLDLTTANGSRTPVATRLDIAWGSFVPTGTIRTMPFLPPEPLVAWRQFRASDARPAGASVAYELSFDGGSTWTAATDGQDLSAAPRAAAIVRATLTTANTSVAPSVASFSLRYEYLGPLFAITVAPASVVLTADDTARFTATAIDEWGHALAFGCIWKTSDPWGTATGNGTLNGTYEAGMVGTWQVRCENSDGSIYGAAAVTVTPGVLARVLVRPDPAFVPVAQTVALTAEGEDADGNAVGLTTTAWSTTIGQIASANATEATLKAPPAPDLGTVTARHGTVSGTATVFVTPEGTPRMNGTIPEQVADEDAPPWRLDLTRFAENQPDPNDTLDNLKWTLTGVDVSLYSVFGQNEFGRHDLWFTPRRDAAGSDVARFWLEDRDGARVFQDVTIRIRPVNDPPAWIAVPEVHVRAGEAYTLDLAPYVRDVDLPPDVLTLTTEDPTRIRTDGMNATYNYTRTYLDRTLYVRHTVSDGIASSTAIVTIHVTDNPPPQLRSPLPDLALTEDVPLVDAFPESLRYYFVDPRGEQLFFSHNFTSLDVDIWDDGAKVRVNVTGMPDFCGADRITFRATDPGGAFREYTVRVAVACVNDPPVLAWAGDVHVQFDRPYRLDFAPFARDVDNAPEELALAASEPTATVDRLAVTFLFTRYDLERRFGPAPTYAVPVDLTLSDPEASAPPVRVTVRVGDNRPPEVIAPIPVQRFDEDEVRVGAIDLRQHFADVDNLPLAYGASGRQVTPSLAGPLVTLTPLRDWYGQDVLLFRATDAAGAFAFATTLADVLPVNDAPRLAPIPDQAGDAGRTWVLDLRPYVSDVDNALPDLTFQADDARVTAVGFVLLFEFPQAATVEIVVTVSDGALEANAPVRVAVRAPDTFPALLPWSAVLVFAAAAAAYVAWTRLAHRYAIEDVFLISREGRLVMHTTRRLRADRDEDILAGMLTAIMLFVRDSFREENEDLKRFEFGDRKVAVERTGHVVGAAIFSGEVPHGVSIHLRAFLEDVEARYGDALVRWSGDVDDLPGLKDMMEEFGRRGRWRPGSWR